MVLAFACFHHPSTRESPVSLLIPLPSSGSSWIAAGDPRSSLSPVGFKPDRWDPLPGSSLSSEPFSGGAFGQNTFSLRVDVFPPNRFLFSQSGPWKVFCSLQMGPWTHFLYNF